MKCPNCNEEIENDSKFCSNCGAKMELHCPKCNDIIKSNDKFCSNCGYKLTSTDKNVDLKNNTNTFENKKYEEDQEKKQIQELKEYRIACIILYIIWLLVLGLNIQRLYECKAETYQELNNKVLSLKAQNDNLREDYASIMNERYRIVRLIEQTAQMVGNSILY